ncbi:hypothetical protein ACP4OV_020258 [Aristida adscensionis]
MGRRFIVASLLVAVAVALVAAAEGRVLKAGNGAAATAAAGFNASTAESKLVIHPRPMIVSDECKHTCEQKQVHYKSLCSSLTKLPGVTTQHELLVAAVRVAMEKAAALKTRIDRYTAEKKAPNPLNSMLGTCSDGYDNTVAYLEEVQKLVDAHGSQKELVSKLSGVASVVVDCDNAFQERSEYNLPFALQVKHVNRLIANILAIATVVKHV